MEVVLHNFVISLCFTSVFFGLGAWVLPKFKIKNLIWTGAFSWCGAVLLWVLLMHPFATRHLTMLLHGALLFSAGAIVWTALARMCVGRPKLFKIITIYIPLIVFFAHLFFALG